MSSFYEGIEDIVALRAKLKNPEKTIIGLKVESKKGIQALDSFTPEKNLTIVVARDDLMTNLDDDPMTLFPFLEKCISLDSEAIVASHLFLGLEHT
jgi:hypothetical protein